MIPLLIALSQGASASDDAGLWFRQQVGFGGWPSGLMEDSRIQYRAPMTRKEGSLVFNDTYAGAGALVRMTPAFAEFGPRLSLAPIDVFDVDLQASRLQYFSRTYGLMGFDATQSKLEADRAERADGGEGVVSGGWSLTVVPTAKIKVGPVIAFDSWTISYIVLDDKGAAEPYTYEPWRDQVIAWTDWTIEQEAGLLITAIDSDDGGGIFYFGADARDRFSTGSPDRSTTLGPIVVVKPARGVGVPRVVGRAMAYLTDRDRVGGVPNLQMAAIWEIE